MIPLFSSSVPTVCGYPDLLDRKNHSDMCPRWVSNPRLPACKASTLSKRPGSPLKLEVGQSKFIYCCWPNGCLPREQNNNPFYNIIAHSLKPHPRKMPQATRRISSACFDVYDAFTSAYTTLSVKHSIAVKGEQK